MKNEFVTRAESLQTSCPQTSACIRVSCRPTKTLFGLPEFLAQQVWCEAWESAFLTVSQVKLMGWSGDHTVNTIALNQREDANDSHQYPTFLLLLPPTNKYWKIIKENQHERCHVTSMFGIPNGSFAQAPVCLDPAMTTANAEATAPHSSHSLLYFLCGVGHKMATFTLGKEKGI